MKYIKRIDEIRGYDRWKTQSPYDNESDCTYYGYLDADITFNIDSRVDDNSIDGSQFKNFCKDMDQFLVKYFKQTKQGLKAVSPLNTKDESYQDWVDNGDGTFAVGSLAWKVTGDFEDVYASDRDGVVLELLPSVKDLQAIARKYKWIDQTKIWLEPDFDSEINDSCED